MRECKETEEADVRHLDGALYVFESVLQQRIFRMCELHLLQGLHQIFATQTVAVQQSDHLLSVQFSSVQFSSVRGVS